MQVRRTAPFRSVKSLRTGSRFKQRGAACCAARASGIGDVNLRQVQRERAAHSGRTLCSRISPPSSRAISRLIEKPSPVPPYLRLVVPSACRNASKMICCLSCGMPMPVS